MSKTPQTDFTLRCSKICVEVVKENSRQINKWGLQDHKSHSDRAEESPHHLRAAYYGIPTAENYKQLVDHQAKTGELSYFDILMEEVCESAEETDPKRLREELIQVAAVCVAFIDKIDRIDLKENK